MGARPNKCQFCDKDPIRIIAENDLAYTVHDGYPVTELHTLIIPKRHADTYYDLTNQERDVFSKADAQLAGLSGNLPSLSEADADIYSKNASPFKRIQKGLAIN